MTTHVGNHVDSRVHPASDLTAAFEWLRVAGRARAEVGRRPFGIFGSSIVVTWLAYEVDCVMHFFIDENPNRQGQHLMERRVLGLGEVLAASVAFVGIGCGVSEGVAWRLPQAAPSVSWVPVLPLV